MKKREAKDTVRIKCKFCLKLGVMLDQCRSLTVITHSLLKGRTLKTWSRRWEDSKLCSWKSHLVITGKVD